MYLQPSVAMTEVTCFV